MQGLHCFCGTSEIEHGLCACMVDNPLAKARGLSLRTGAQTMLYLSLSTSETHLCFIDCGTPAKTGYTYTGTSGFTYGETSSVACADGYEGTISISTVTCEATGAWTAVTGCTIKGGKIVIIKYQPAK